MEFPANMKIKRIYKANVKLNYFGKECFLMIRGLVACGSGIATSTVAQEAVKKILTEAGFDVNLTKGNLTEIPQKQNGVDIIFVTSNYDQPVKVPVIKVFGLISGINKDKIKDQIIETCKKIESSK